MTYFIAYDIADSKRLVKISHILENYGIRIQYSFFECEMEKTVMEELRNRIISVMDLKEDSLNIYPVCGDCMKLCSSIGNGNIFVPKKYEVL